MKIKGYVDSFSYRNPDSSFGIFTFVSEELEEGELKCVGPVYGLDEGDYLEVDGIKVVHPTYGPQIKMSSFRILPPDESRSALKYLSSGAIKGIGPEGRDELWIGGIIGKQLSGKIHIENCVNYGTVTNDKGFAGGIIGDFGHDKAFDESYICEILNCLNEGSISATTNAGGIVGLTKGCHVKITNCTNTGAVTSSGNDAAGIIGHGGVKSILSRVFVTKCLNEGKITCTGGTID